MPDCQPILWSSSSVSRPSSTTGDCMNYDDLKSAARKLSTQGRSRLLADLAGSLSKSAWPHAKPVRTGDQKAEATGADTKLKAKVAPGKEAWEVARSLPDWISPHWRSPERWRRLAEARLAGQQLLRLDGFMTQAGASALLNKVKALPLERQDNTYLRGLYYQVTESKLKTLLPDFANGVVRQLLSATLNKPLPSSLFLRAFQLNEGDLIAEHVDGEHYAATFSIGLCEHWTAANGGAIAFGEQRWLPHLGDVLVFVTSRALSHRVEPVMFGERFTLTGQYVSARYPA